MKRFVCGILIGCICTVGIGSMADGIWDNISVLKNDITVYVDGQEIVADNFLYNDTTYLPIRTVSEALGKNVEYDESVNAAYIGERKDTMSNINLNKYTPPEDIINDDLFIWVMSDKYVATGTCIWNYVEPLGVEVSGDSNKKDWIFLKDGKEIYRYPIQTVGIYYDDLIDIVLPALKERLGLN